MEELFYRYNPWWEEKYTPKGLIERLEFLNLLKEHLSSKQVIFLTGLRRVGKTTLLKLLINYLIDQKKVDPKHIFYISLDDYHLKKISILDIIDEYRKMHKIPFEEKIFLFLDEVGYKDNFEIQIKNLYDSQNAKIYASSSSASIIKSKKPYLTGRNIVIEALPLDFDEYLKFKKITIKKADKKLKEKYFEEYLNTGGLPEYVLTMEAEYLKELVDDIIKKDIVSFYKIKNPKILEDFFMLLMERAGKIASINKLANILKISPDSASRYLKMFADSYLIYLVPRFGKTNDKILAPKKIYAADLGIRTFFTGFRDIGSLFENYVYLKIRHLEPYYVYENEMEIDFLTKGKSLVEVKYNQSLKGKQKEFFEQIPAKERIVVNGISDIDKLEKIV
ncbi:MAG: ATP-binding protein [bacterium]